MRQFLLAIAIAEEAVVADALKTLRQDVEQEPADELVGGEGHRAKAIAVSVVLPAEANVPVIDREQTIVGDRDAMRITPDVVQDPLRPGERRLGVNQPFGDANRRQVLKESCVFIEVLQG